MLNHKPTTAVDPDPGQAGDAPLVDAHAHIFDRTTPLAETAWHRPAAEAPLAAYMAELDAAGVHFAVLAAASIFGDYNDHMLAAVAGQPRLRTTVILRPDTDPARLRDLDQAGVVGIRLQLRNVAAPPDLDSFEYRCLFRRIADLGWHVHLHDEGDRIARFIPQVENAGPRLVIDHYGRPETADAPGFRAVLDAVGRGRTWVKLSAAFRLGAQAPARTLAQALIDAGGAERLLWGSDWPFVAFEDSMTYPEALRQYRQAVPSEPVRRAIDRTALSFYFA